MSQLCNTYQVLTTPNMKTLVTKFSVCGNDKKCVYGYMTLMHTLGVAFRDADNAI